MDTEVFVHVDIGDRPLPVGRLWTQTRRGRDRATFEHEDLRLALESSL